jgi:hypothetical protein
VNDPYRLLLVNPGPQTPGTSPNALLDNTHGNIWRTHEAVPRGISPNGNLNEPSATDAKAGASGVIEKANASRISQKGIPNESRMPLAADADAGMFVEKGGDRNARGISANGIMSEPTDITVKRMQTSGTSARWGGF